MLATLIIWLYIFLLATIYGFTIVNAMPGVLRIARPLRVSLPVTAMLGLALLTALTDLFSLVIKTGLVTNLVLFIASLGLALFQLKALVEFLREKVLALRQVHLAVLLLFGAIFVVVLAKAAQTPLNYDTGLYHAQAIRWIETYPAVPGLGILNDRLAFDSNWLVANALFSFSFLGLQSFHTLGAFLVILTAAYCAGKFNRLFQGELSLSSSAAIIGIFLIRRIFPLEFSSPGTDMPAALLVWVIFLLSLEKIEKGNLKVFDGNSLAIVTLSLYVLTIKLSVIPVLLLPMYFLIAEKLPVTWGRSRRMVEKGDCSPALHRAQRGASVAKERLTMTFESNHNRFNLSTLATQAGIAALLLLPWMARNVVLSGYLVYPVPEVNLFNPDWKIPLQQARGTEANIRAWARDASNDTAVLKAPLSAWLPVWYRLQDPADIQLIWGSALGTVLLLGAAALTVVRQKKIPAGAPRYFIAYLAALAGLVYWFSEAPAIRFGYGFIGIFLCLLFAPLLQWLLSRSGHWFSLALFVIVAALILYQGVSVYKLVLSPDLRTILVLPAGYPQAPTAAHAVGSFTVYTPTHGDQCWYAPFPCVPTLGTHVSLRGASLGGGFRSSP